MVLQCLFKQRHRKIPNLPSLSNVMASRTLLAGVSRRKGDSWDPWSLSMHSGSNAILPGRGGSFNPPHPTLVVYICVVSVCRISPTQTMPSSWR